jgi:hypothetical protein
MPGIIARRPNNHHHSISKKADGLKPRLAIIPAHILYRNRRTGKDDRGIGKIQASLVECRLTFY